MIRHRTLRVLALVATFVLGAAASAEACTKTYRGPANGTWQDATHWTPSGVPTTSDAVCVPANHGTVHVTSVGSPTAAFRTLNTAATSGASAVQVDSGATVTVGTGGALLGGRLIDNGTIAGPLNVKAGTLAGSGLVKGDVVVSGGTLTPGTDGSIGNLSFGARFTLATHGTLKIDLASDSSFDTLLVGGAGPSFRGAVKVRLLGSYQAVDSGRWDVLVGAVSPVSAPTSVSPTIFGATASGKNWTIYVKPYEATLTAAPRVVVDGNAANTFPATCGLTRGAVGTCSVVGTVNGVEVAAGSANGPNVTLTINATGIALANAPGGARATLTANVTPPGGEMRTATTHIVVTLVRKQTVLRIVSDVLFAFDSARLTAAGRRQLAADGRLLHGSARLRCEGHTDSIGSLTYNQRLGLARARAVCAVLRTYVHHVSSISYGETVPVATNSTAAGRKKNRRVEIRIFN
jgi:outer membrane protein OmpA-like peptidoglycan-associated protein